MENNETLHPSEDDYAYRATGSDKMRYRLAQAAKACILADGFESVTVTQIVRACGVTRQTFYRNFADKYALVNWYFDKLLLASFDQMGEGRTVRECLEKKFEYIDKERVFFAIAFRVDGQNALKEYDYELILEFYTNFIRHKTGQELDEDLLFPLRFYCHGSVNMTLEWIFDVHPCPGDELAARMVAVMPPKLSALFASLGLL
ncbi:MAG: TetR/AcrR family transcriptional regulator C-terminal domain-containing protein [Peptococcaceae bacterium]|nr:TetR/AcrR family transcriptional regulator C-terminal domain-containing protein [Peptococcaceae bacterium]